MSAISPSDVTLTVIATPSPAVEAGDADIPLPVRTAHGSSLAAILAQMSALPNLRSLTAMSEFRNSPTLNSSEHAHAS